jgi:cytoskeletal protein CcmA (bactofilin family)
MFIKEKNASSDRTTSTSATLISAGTKLNGNVSSDNDLRIDGTILGNVTSSSKIIIGPTGFVEGNIESQQADVLGRVQGHITVTDLLQLRGSCHVQGNISSSKLQVEPTATFNGKCQMGAVGNVVQMSSNELQAEAK